MVLSPAARVRALGLGVAAAVATMGAWAQTPVLGYQVVATYAHDSHAFTQGLVFTAGALFESTGRYGLSSLRRLDVETGRVSKLRRLPKQYFGEGLTAVEDRLIQLTWRENRAFVYDRETFELLDRFEYPGEGWGIAYDGERLIMSDGSDTLRLLDARSYRRTGSLKVRDAGRPVRNLNELEFVDGLVYANVWRTDTIVRIDPRTGRVRDRIDLSGLLPPVAAREADVLNGIAFDAERRRLFVTGKLWPRLFEIEIVSPDAGNAGAGSPR